MLKPRPDVQEEIVTAFRQAEDDPADSAELLDPFQYVASANYVIPMLLALAIERANEVVDHVPRYSSAEHSAVWSDLLAAMARFDSFEAPYFNERLATDPFAEELLRYEHGRMIRRHFIASFEQEMWQLVEDSNGLRIHLSAPTRRSALHLVANKADFHASDEKAQKLLRDIEPEGIVEELLLVTGTARLGVFAESCPAAWERLLAGLPFSFDRVPRFRAFALSLGRSGLLWYRRDRLWELWEDMSAERRIDGGDRAEFEALVDFHAVSVEEGRQWGTQALFIRFGDVFAPWPFVFHVLHPDLNFLTLLTRRYETLWNQTVGAELAAVADRLAARLDGRGGILARARRSRKGVGEADLALLDTGTGDVLVLELKTVFDKFRTHVQLSNYTGRKVNFPKAIGQARVAADAIRDGRWALRDLFGKEAPTAPATVTPGVLTWWDTYNPTLGTEEPILCCNFATLEYLFDEAPSVAEVVAAVGDLSRIYCPGVLTPAGVAVGGKEVEFRREVQTDVLPPLSTLDADLCPLARSVIADLPRVPDDWEAVPQASPEAVPFLY